MPLHPALQGVLSDELANLLQQADAGNFQPITNRIGDFAATDTYRQPFAGEEGTKYYKPFVQTVVPKIISALQASLPQGRCPEIEVLASEIDATRQAIGIEPFGSPQDVLYGFTSERYPEWGPTLDAMGFTSACMTGQASAIVCMAPRLLQLKQTPDAEVEELEGAITRDFWESVRVVFGKNTPAVELGSLLKIANIIEPPFDVQNPTPDTALAIQNFLTERIQNGTFQGPPRYRAEELVELLSTISQLESEPTRVSRTRRLFRLSATSPKISQEQIGLKYVDEGKFLQKLLGGARVEHLQSNVKMVKNPLRGNKCEVDSIYRVVGEKRIVLVESKDKRRVSRAQLYQLYETYRLRLPLGWALDVVAVLLEKPNAAEEANGFITFIDLVKVGFDDAVFGRVTESLLAVRPDVQYRWKIKRQSQAG